LIWRLNPLLNATLHSRQGYALTSRRPRHTPGIEVGTPKVPLMTFSKDARSFVCRMRVSGRSARACSPATDCIHHTFKCQPTDDTLNHVCARRRGDSPACCPIGNLAAARLSLRSASRRVALATWVARYVASGAGRCMAAHASAPRHVHRARPVSCDAEPARHAGRWLAP
jgi:hypothetical protein